VELRGCGILRTVGLPPVKHNNLVLAVERTAEADACNQEVARCLRRRCGAERFELVTMTVHARDLELPSGAMVPVHVKREREVTRCDDTAAAEDAGRRRQDGRGHEAAIVRRAGIRPGVATVSRLRIDDRRSCDARCARATAAASGGGAAGKDDEHREMSMNLHESPKRDSGADQSTAPAWCAAFSPSLRALPNRTPSSPALDQVSPGWPPVAGTHASDAGHHRYAQTGARVQHGVATCATW